MSPVCLITGATGGLGSELARTFWGDGWSLLLVGRDAQALAAQRGTFAERPGQWAQSMALDLAQPAAAHQVIAWARSVAPRLTVLINNAAVQGPVGALWENDWEEWLEALQVDFVTPAALCREAAPWMIEGGGGCIINLGGGGAGVARPRFSAYACAKTALVRLTETLARELAPFGVTVNCVAPGVLPTAMLARLHALGPAVSGPAEHARAAPADDGGAALARAARLCRFLASDAARGITGRLLSAAWDAWSRLPEHLAELRDSDIYTLRRIVPRDRGASWGDLP